MALKNKTKKTMSFAPILSEARRVGQKVGSVHCTEQVKQAPSHKPVVSFQQRQDCIKTETVPVDTNLAKKGTKRSSQPKIAVRP